MAVVTVDIMDLRQRLAEYERVFAEFAAVYRDMEDDEGGWVACPTCRELKRFVTEWETRQGKG